MLRGPKDTGYNFESKQRYRENLWQWIDANSLTPIHKRRVCYLDTRQALETIYLLSLGYSAENLHPCNFNPAEVAMLTRLLDTQGLSRVSTHGVAMSRVVESCGRFDAVSFDGCGHVAGESQQEIRRISAAMKPGSILAATVLAGRESGEASVKLGEFKKQTDQDNAHYLRLQWLMAAICDVTKNHQHGLWQRWLNIGSAHGVYISSSRQPMLFAAVKLKYFHRCALSKQVVRLARKTNQLQRVLNCEYAKNFSDGPLEFPRSVYPTKV